MNTTLLVLLVVGAIAFLFPKVIRKKKADSVKSAGMILAVVAALLMFLGTAVPDPIGGFLPAAVTPSGVPVATGGGVITSVCGIEDVALTPKMSRLNKAGTSLSTSSYNYYILSDGIGQKSASSATTVPSNSNFKIMFGENSTTYYTKVMDVFSDCQDPKFVDVKLPYYESSLNSFYAQLSDGSVMSSSNLEAVGASESGDLTVTIKAGTDTWFGNPYSSCNNIAVVEFDKTYISTAGGQNPVAVPGSFSFTNSTYDGSAAFIIPKVADGGSGEFNLEFTSTGTEPDSNALMVLNLYDCDYDKDEDTLEIIEGVEDEDLNSISLAAQALQIYMS